MTEQHEDGWSFGLRTKNGGYIITEEFGTHGYTTIGHIDAKYTKQELYFMFKDLKALINSKQKLKGVNDARTR